MIGRTISHYRILEEVGRGGMGVVYKAEDTKLKRTVALKFLPQGSLRDSRAKERFILEAQAASALEHTNICTIHEIDETEDGRLFIVMAFYEGQTLKEKIEKGPLPIDEAVEIAVQIARGLARAHEQKIVHRDIKPANIFLTKEGVVKILDFGLAKLSNRSLLTTEGTTLGTAAYMSPEQATGKEADHRSDIWALGVVLYEMMTGRLPFRGEYEQAVVYAILNEDPPPPTALRTDVPLDLERIILKALAKNPDKRYQYVDEMANDLKNAVKGNDTSRWQPPRQKARPNWLKTGVLVFLLLLILSIGFLTGKSLIFKQTVHLAPRPIAVITFENQTGDPQYDYLKMAIPNLLISKLEQSRLLRVTTWERMHDLLEQMGRPKVTTIDKNLGFQLCQRDSVHIIVLGSFTKAGQVFATDVKVLDVQTKRLLKTASASGEGAGSILKSQIDRLSEQIIRGIGLSARLEKKEIRQPISDITTTSLQAYRYFLKAENAFVNMSSREAVHYCRQAIQIDSTFARAYVLMALATKDPQVEKEAYRKAHAFVHKAGKKWQYWINGFYALRFENDRQKGIAYLEKMAEEFPREKVAHLSLGWTLFNLGETDRAIASLERAVDLDPHNGGALNILGYAYLRKGDRQKARTCFQKYVAAFPGEPNPYDSMGDFYFATGQLEEALAFYHKALQKEPEFGSRRKIAYLLALQEKYPAALEAVNRYFIQKKSLSDQAEGHLYNGLYFYWLGKSNRALGELSRSVQLAESLKDRVLPRYAHWLKIWIYGDRADLREARQQARAWYDSFTQKQDVEQVFFHKLTYQFALGMLDLRASEIDSAQIRLSVMESYRPEIKRRDTKGQADFYFRRFKGELFLKQNKFDEASAAFRQMTRLFYTWMAFDPNFTLIIGVNTPFTGDLRARILQKQNRIGEAIAAYENLLNGENLLLVHPLYHFRLAQLYEQNRQPGKAVVQYRKFLQLTQGADLFSEERALVRAHLSKLTRADGEQISATRQIAVGTSIPQTLFH